MQAPRVEPFLPTVPVVGEGNGHCRGLQASFPGFRLEHR
jgi:hypothetical protein